MLVVELSKSQQGQDHEPPQLPVGAHEAGNGLGAQAHQDRPILLYRALYKSQQAARQTDDLVAGGGLSQAGGTGLVGGQEVVVLIDAIIVGLASGNILQHILQVVGVSRQVRVPEKQPHGGKSANSGLVHSVRHAINPSCGLPDDDRCVLRLSFGVVGI